jgi:hypothetical protein
MTHILCISCHNKVLYRYRVLRCLCIFHTVIVLCSCLLYCVQTYLLPYWWSNSERNVAAPWGWGCFAETCRSHGVNNEAYNLVHLLVNLRIWGRPCLLPVSTVGLPAKIRPVYPLNPLTPELNPSAQRCLTRFFLGTVLLEPWISLIYAWKTNKCNNNSFSLLIMYGSSDMFRHYIPIFRERFQCLLRDAKLRSSRYNIVDGRVVFSDVVRGDLRDRHSRLSTAPQLSISQKALGTPPVDGNVMPKHVGATIHY